MDFKTAFQGDTSDREIAHSRLYDAPVERVFQMWIDPKHIVRWWGPRGFTNTVHLMDVRPGGRWSHTMHGPDGTDYKNESVYDEIVPNERLYYFHENGPKHWVKVHFTTEGKQTRVSMRLVFESAELRERVVKQHGAVEGMKDTLNRLNEAVLSS